jgi:hypothetical protein
MAYLDESYNQRFIRNPYSEQDILYLHETFLMAGFHTICVPSHTFGRTIMKTFLRSLNYYTDIACLTTQPSQLGGTVTDLFTLLHNYGALKSRQRLNEFIIEEFDFDFLWIEEKPAWLVERWYLEFEEALKAHHADKFMPIIIIKKSL